MKQPEQRPLGRLFAGAWRNHTELSIRAALPDAGCRFDAEPRL